MPKPKSTLEERYQAVQLCLDGRSPYSVSKQYGMSNHTLEGYVRLYRKYGIEGLKNKATSQYSIPTILAILRDFRINKLSLNEVLDKYDLTYGTFRHWQKEYGESEKEYSYLPSEIHTEQGYTIKIVQTPMEETAASVPKPKIKTQTMQESKEKQERRKALSKLSKKELQELLLDREAELDILKNLEALEQERENQRRRILRGLSRD